MILMQAKKHLRRAVAEIIHQAVVKAAIARAGIEADKGDAKSPEHLGRDVAAPGDFLVGLSFNSV